ncbi:MAG: hypothetical protein ACI9AB_002385, partial [Urechidicola sp.]
MKKFLFVCLFPLQCLFAQDVLEQTLSAHVYFLSDDKLEGRATGSEGEAIALKYIAEYFEVYGLSPKGERGFSQAFDFTLGKKAGITNAMKVNNNTMEILKDYFPMTYSGNGAIHGELLDLGFGIHAPGTYDDYANKTELEGKVFA